MTAPDAGPPRDPRRWIAVGAVLCALAVVLFFVGDLLGRTRPEPPPAPRAGTLAAPIPQPAESAEHDDAAGAQPLPPAIPTRLQIATIGIDTELGTVGRTDEGNIGAPSSTDADKAAWYKLSVTPGERGTAVIVGHVDSTDGPAVFYRLAMVERGDKVQIARTDGQVAVFAVDAIRTYPKAAFPARDVLKPRGRPELRLITCGGRFEPRTGYTANVIVFAHLV